MIVKVRTQPLVVWYVTGQDACDAREAAGEVESYQPCFVTDSFGDDGFAWNSAEDFESSYKDAFGSLDAEIPVGVAVVTMSP